MPDHLRGDHDCHETEADQEAGVEVAPDQEQGEKEQRQPAATAQVAIGDIERQAGEGERDHLRARTPDGVSGDHCEDHAAAEHQGPRPVQACAQEDAEHAQPADHAQHRDHRRQAVPPVQRGKEHLAEPLVHGPGVTAHGVREGVAVQQPSRVDDQLAAAQVPPEVRVADGAGERERRRDQHRAEEEATGGGDACRLGVAPRCGGRGHGARAGHVGRHCHPPPAFLGADFRMRRRGGPCSARRSVRPWPRAARRPGLSHRRACS